MFIIYDVPIGELLLVLAVVLPVMGLVRLACGAPRTYAERRRQGLYVVAIVFAVGLVGVGYIWWLGFSFLASQ